MLKKKESTQNKVKELKTDYMQLKMKAGRGAVEMQRTEIGKRLREPLAGDGAFFTVSYSQAGTARRACNGVSDALHRQRGREESILL